MKIQNVQHFPSNSAELLNNWYCLKVRRTDKTICHLSRAEVLSEIDCDALNGFRTQKKLLYTRINWVTQNYLLEKTFFHFKAEKGSFLATEICDQLCSKLKTPSRVEKLWKSSKQSGVELFHSHFVF